MKNISAIIQARVSSTRLPEKVLLNLPFDTYITVLQQVIRRVQKSKKVNEIIIATTTDTDDDKIIKIAEKEQVKWFRGSKEDVLSRYYFVAKEAKSDIIVRITSDCPCIDWKIMDKCIKKHIEEKADYTSNNLERTFPHGLDVEVFNFDILEEAHQKADKQYEREHVCPYFYKTMKGRFKIVNVYADDDERGEDIRITLDTPEDYALLCTVYDYLFWKKEFFELKDILKLFNEKPWLKFINQKIVQKKIFDTLEEELEEGIRILKLQDLYRSAEILEKSRVK